MQCIHRHSIAEHPACFAQGMIGPKQLAAFERETGTPWYQHQDMRMGYLDIETDNLKADFGTMLSWAIKEKDGPTTYGVITREELFDGTTDRNLVNTLVQELSKYKIIVTYYGTGFDMPFTRAKALHYNLPFPGYGEQYHFDLYYLVKSKLCISRKSLAVATAYLGIPGKTPLTGEVCNAAKYGHPIALGKVVEHNVADVEILEQLHNRLSPFRKWVRTSIQR